MKTGVRFNGGLGADRAARVYLTMHGTAGLTNEIELDHAWRPLFQRGAVDVFVITTPFDIGRIRRVNHTLT